jgi:Fe2+ transport system protein FeoA
VKSSVLIDQSQILPLKGLKSGQRATVVEVVGSERTIKCLAELGLQQGSRLKIIVPGPSAVCQIGDATLSLRVCGHCDIFVRLDP